MTLDHFENAGRREILTHMHPFRGLGTPDDLAKVCVFLASDDAQRVTGVSTTPTGSAGTSSLTMPG